MIMPELGSLGHGVMVAIVGGVGKVGVVDRRADDGVPSSHCRGFLDKSGSSFSIDVVDGEVGGSDAETHGIRDVIDGLDKAVGVNVAVGSAGDTVGGLELLLGLGWTGEAIVVLADVILSVELRVDGINWSAGDDGGGDGRGLGSDGYGRGGVGDSVGVVLSGIAIVGGIGQVGVGYLGSKCRGIV